MSVSSPIRTPRTLLSTQRRRVTLAPSVLLLGALAWPLSLAAQNSGLHAQVNPDGRYSLGLPDSSQVAVTTDVAAQVNGRWLQIGRASCRERV